ncbi:MAG: AAA family ATPase, partial [Holosporales bacterium]|nr:AAA family ATPase [Holosporales bacterium]
MLYFKRSLSLPLNQNILLFGARNTGKSTLLRHTFNSQQSLWIDLLDYEEEERYRRNPARLISEVQALDDSVTHVVIDEVQKLPQLLNAVHYLIEN